MRRPSLRTTTISLVALALPTTILIGGIISAYFKSANPDNVDITQGLAYLQQSLFASVLTFGIFTIAIIVGIVKMHRRDHGFVEAKLPLVLLSTVFLLIISALLVNAYTNKVQDQYLINNGRPTLQQFFDKLKEQEK